MYYRNLYIDYNSFYEGFKKPFGAIVTGQEILFRLKATGSDHIEVTLVMAQEGKSEQFLKMAPEGDGFYKVVSTGAEPGLLFYYFIISFSEKLVTHTIYVGAQAPGIGGEAVLRENRWDVVPYQITLHQFVEPAPSWYKDAVFYQIFVDRFYNGHPEGKILNPKKNSFVYATWEDTPMYIKDCQGSITRWDFFGGNLEGVLKKLDYLQELGIGGIYLNPIFKSRSNHKYDTGDFLAIDEMFGSEEIFQELVLEAQKRGIRIVLDGVFNHVGADSRYFNSFGSYPELGAAQSPDSPYYSWFNFFQYPTDYECWWGVKDLPNVNENNPTYRNFIVGPEGVIEKWTRMGIGGWRLDVADELPDDFIADIRSSMQKANPDTVLLGEVWEDASNKIAYGQRRRYLLGKEIHGTMNYPFKNGVIDYLKGHLKARELYHRLMALKENYPREAFYSALNSLGTHDTKRIFTEISDKEHLKIAVGMLFTFPGVPCIYYGDEAGMKGEADPDNRGPYPWGKEDPEIMEMYRSMIALRKSSPVYVGGELHPFYQENTFGYLRLQGEEASLIIINREPEDVRLVLNDALGLDEVTEQFRHILTGEYHLKAKSFNVYQL